MDPFHVVRLAGDALDRCRRRVEQDLHGHRGRKDDPLYRARRTLHTGADLLTDRQHQRLTASFGVEDHVAVEATWGVYQRMLRAYAQDPLVAVNTPAWNSRVMHVGLTNLNQYKRQLESDDCGSVLVRIPGDTRAVRFVDELLKAYVRLVPPINPEVEPKVESVLESLD